MNKTQVDQIRAIVSRAKRCVLGKIEEDINNRLPKEPEEKSAWQKYQMIRNGLARLNHKLTVKDLMGRYSRIKLVDAFTYPETKEEAAYKKAEKDCRAEKRTREMAVELAFNRAGDEVITGVIDHKSFLDRIERMQQEQW